MDTHSQTAGEEKLPPENMKGEQKPYQFKKQENGKFKVFHRDTDVLLEGFEQEEFGSPLVGGRYIAALLNEADVKIREKTQSATTATATMPHDDSSTETKGFEIPIIGDDPEIHIIGGTQYFELVVHEQDGDAKRKDIFLTDGCSRDFQVNFDVPVMLPKGCLNVLRECIYTQHECVDNVQQGSVLLIEKQVPRFSIQVIREVPQAEAEEWLRDKKKVYLKKA